MGRDDTSDPEVTWTPARLIPATGIRGTEEQEARATQALLSVMRGVPDFGSTLLRLCGGPRGTRRVDAYTEIRLEDADGKGLRPDGALVVRAPRLGRMSWLVEVKTGRSLLESEQVDAYLDLAREGGFTGLITISNEITSSPEESPVELPRRKGRQAARPPLYHLSWARILAEAVVAHQHRGVDDPDQAWILGELIAYLDDERSGVLPFRDMGRNWSQVRDDVRKGQLRADDPGTVDVVERFEQLIDFLCIGLYRELGVPVVATSNRGVAEERRAGLARRLCEEGKLTGEIRIRDAAAPLEIDVDLRARVVTTTIEVAAPEEPQRPTARVNWLARQLRGVAGQPAERDLHLVAVYGGRGSVRNGRPLEQVRQDPALVLHPSDAKRPPRAFRLALVRDMATQGRRQDGFIDHLQAQVVDFYRDVIQAVTPYRPRPPRLREAVALPADIEPPPTGEVVDADRLAGPEPAEVPVDDAERDRAGSDAGEG
jgi:hypothetical protein